MFHSLCITNSAFRSVISTMYVQSSCSVGNASSDTTNEWIIGRGVLGSDRYRIPRPVICLHSWPYHFTQKCSLSAMPAHSRVNVKLFPFAVFCCQELLIAWSLSGEGELNVFIILLNMCAVCALFCVCTVRMYVCVIKPLYNLKVLEHSAFFIMLQIVHLI